MTGTPADRASLADARRKCVKVFEYRLIGPDGTGLVGSAAARVDLIFACVPSCVVPLSALEHPHTWRPDDRHSHLNNLQEIVS